MQMTISEMAKKGGSVKSGKKTESSRKNGVLGGRPIGKTTINDDGVSIKQCSIVYAPNGKAGEYAPLATNPYRGCGNGCKYCYVPNVIRMKRRDFDNFATPRKDFINNLERDLRKYQKCGITEQVMLSFTTDPYHPYDTSLTSKVIECLQYYGMGVCTLTKGGARALRDIELFRPKRDAFASTLTSVDDKFSRKWEPNAALASERIETLKKFHDNGIFTWVSIEPTLNVEEAVRVVNETYKFVDLYKVGKANYIGNLDINWEDYTIKICDLMQSLNKKHYIKKDLQMYLPSGYYNPMRIQQHF